uniref:AlNc14C2G321 protein n=1 Tax=Albugo laibachii Nc14 TaxID=890382 RepID=F0VZI3_9STRA|nr:AlNc14C2G321 [Albugo laibachii Nc14]|eukprot:CCA14213.1 AlNc14C2G321 [Albugo laibachii Nc14]
MTLTYSNNMQNYQALTAVQHTRNIPPTPIKPKATAPAVHRPVYRSLEKKPLRKGPSMPFLCDVSLSDIAKSVEGHFSRIK